VEIIFGADSILERPGQQRVMTDDLEPGAGRAITSSALQRGFLRALRSLTRALIAVRPDACEECARFLRLRRRRIAVPKDSLDAWPRSARVLVHRRIMAAVRQHAEVT
jgi:hypothetical protein